MSKTLVCGDRNFTDRALLYATLDRFHAERCFDVLIAGGARGADTMAAEWAQLRGVAPEIYMPDWKRFGRAAGPIRSKQMLEDGKPDLVIAFPGDRGTAGMIKLARAGGVEVVEISCSRRATPTDPPPPLS